MRFSNHFFIVIFTIGIAFIACFCVINTMNKHYFSLYEKTKYEDFIG